MHDVEIERRLRLPAPDEPTVLPALMLPVLDAGFARARGHVRLGRQSRAILGAPPLAFAILALLVAMLGVIATGMIRLERLPNPFKPEAGLGGRGIYLEFPKGWHELTPPDPFGQSIAGVLAIVSNMAIDGCAESDLPIDGSGPQPTTTDNIIEVPEGYVPPLPLQDRMLDCADAIPLRAGEVRIAVLDSFGPRPGFALPEPGGVGRALWERAASWEHVIGGAPADLAVIEAPIGMLADEARLWTVGQPGDFSRSWRIRATMRGPDLEALRTQVERIAQSLRFDHAPPPLDETRRDEALATVIDGIDREWREWRNSDMFGCLPRVPGAREATLTSGPDGPLSTAIAVTCRTEIAPTALRLWRATLTVEWEAADGVDAGDKGWEWFFEQDGKNVGGGELDEDAAVIFPGTVGELPPPLDGPLTIPMWSVVEVLPPGTQGPIARLFGQPNETIGQRVFLGATGRLHVVGGPVAHVDTDWYLVRAQVSTTHSELAWVPATDEGRPLIQVVEPSCPTGDVDVVTILDLIPAERLICFGPGEIVLEPTMLDRIKPDPGGSVSGTPDWLAEDPDLKLYGSGGPTGVEGAMPVQLSPTLKNPPVGAWLRVRGHFDDAASADCKRTYPQGWDVVPETPAVQVQICREAFVITGYEPSTAP